MKVSDVMTRDVQLIEPTQTIRDAAKLMAEPFGRVLPAEALLIARAWGERTGASWLPPVKGVQDRLHEARPYRKADESVYF